MTHVTPIAEGFATGDEINPIIQRVEDLLIDVPRVHVLIALTTIILVLQHPTITPNQIYDGVKDVSRFICTWLAGIDAEVNLEPLDKSKLN